jgi:integrase/recombinase XerD
MRKLSIGFHPNPKRKDKSSKKTQIVMRVLMDGCKSEIRLPKEYDLSEKDLLRWNPFIQRLETKDSDVNDYLNSIVARRKLIDLENIANGKQFSSKEIIEKLIGSYENTKETTIYEYAKRYLRDEVENSYKKEGTKKNYRNAINQFCIFLELKGWKNLAVENFKFEQASAFKKFLETPQESLQLIGIDKYQCNKLYDNNVVGGKIIKQKQKTQNSICSSSTKIKNLRPIFEKAIDEDLIHKNPFKKIKVCFDAENETPTLSSGMLKRVFYLKTSNDGIEYTKDIFLFMCFTGMSYVDASNFNDKDFEIIDGNIYLLDTMRRTKSNCKIRQVLCNEAAKIVYKYYQKGYNYNNTNVFPYETIESINRKLKTIQGIADIPFDLTTKSGRVTFKNSIKESKYHNPFVTRKLMGWGKSKSIEDIYDRFTVNDFMEVKECFDVYIKSILNN